MTCAAAFAPLGNGGLSGETLGDRPGFITAAYAVTSAEKQAEVDAALQRVDEYQTELNRIMDEYGAAAAVRLDAEMRMKEALAREIEAQKRIDELQEQLGALAAQMYRNGPISFLEVVFGAQSFSDFVAALEMNNRISARRAELIAENKVVRNEAEAARIEYTNQERIAAEKEAEIKILLDQQQAIVDAMMIDIIALQKEQAELLVKEELEAEAARLKKQQEERNKAIGNYTVEPALASRVPSLVFPAPDYRMVSSPFGYRGNELHQGVDLAGPAWSPIYAAASGTVTAAGYQGSMGYYIIINHGNGVRTIYMHCNALYVSAGNWVYAGQHIAALGSTGNSTGPHLHFQLEIDTIAVNPMVFLI